MSAPIDRAALAAYVDGPTPELERREALLRGWIDDALRHPAPHRDRVFVGFLVRCHRLLLAELDRRRATTGGSLAA